MRCESFGQGPGPAGTGDGQNEKRGGKREERMQNAF